MFGVSSSKSFKDARKIHSSQSFSEVEPMVNLDRNGIIRKIPPDNHHPNCVLNCSSDISFIPQKMVAKKGEMSHSRAEVRGRQGLENPPVVWFSWISHWFVSLSGASPTSWCHVHSTEPRFEQMDVQLSSLLPESNSVRMVGERGFALSPRVGKYTPQLKSSSAQLIAG